MGRDDGLEEDLHRRCMSSYYCRIVIFSGKLSRTPVSLPFIYFSLGNFSSIRSNLFFREFNIVNVKVFVTV